MRNYRDFIEARNEIRRDLAELGVSVHTATYQDKDIADDPEMATKELRNYIYSVIDPDFTKIEGVHEEWVEMEWKDRLLGGRNPGRAWRLRREVWLQFLEYGGSAGKGGLGRFSYTYSERMGGKNLQAIISRIKEDPTSRQLYLSVWDRSSDIQRLGHRRVPCSLGYHFMIRDGQLHLTYSMRSCDFATHYPNDIALATMMQRYVADETGYEVGSFTHFINSFHVYQRDVADVF